jgi:hypothetical protein
MSFLLLKRPNTIPAWGLCDGMQFTVIERDEFLLGLFLYTLQKRKRQWIAVPLFKKDQRQPYENTVTMVFEPYRSQTSWSIQHDVSVSPYATTVIDCQSIDSVAVLFFGKIDSGQFIASVSYMTCISTLEGFYYVKVSDWSTRCSSVEECVALFDAIELNADRISAAIVKSRICSETIDYLSREMPREQDPVRLASMLRKMQMMEQDADALHSIGL